MGSERRTAKPCVLEELRPYLSGTETLVAGILARYAAARPLVVAESSVNRTLSPCSASGPKD